MGLRPDFFGQHLSMPTTARDASEARQRVARLRPRTVGIVGGGPGGLLTAWHLERLTSSPLAITIFEASTRLGGKVLTPSFSSTTVRYEAGAAEFYDYSPIDDDPLRTLVRSLGLATIPLDGAAVHITGRRIANLDDVQDVLGSNALRGMRNFDAWARSAMTRQEFYESGSDHARAAVLHDRFADSLTISATPPVRHYVEAMIHSDLATEPACTTTAYGLQNYLMNDPTYMRLYRIMGGNDQLIRALACRLAAEVRLQATVTNVATSSSGTMIVTSQDHGCFRQDEFEAIVLALPVAPLKCVSFEDTRLADAMRKHIVRHDHPAHYLRVTLLVDSPLEDVPGKDDFIMTEAFGGTCIYIENARDPTSRYGVIGLLLAGQAATDLCEEPDDELVNAALDNLPTPLNAYRHRVLEARVHRWAGAVSAAPGGWPAVSVDRRHRPSEQHPNLFVVGDYLFDSTLNGVLDSAAHVAGWLASELATGR